MIYPMFLSTGIMILALEAYFIRHWWVLQLVIVVPCILSMSYWWITPESPRWLISKGRMQEAEMTIRKIAKINNVTEYRDLLSEAFQLDAKLNQDVSNKRDQLNYGAVDLLRYPNMRKKTVIMFYSWITATLVYYGISFDTSSLGGNPYVNTFISGAVEIPAYALGMVMMKTPRIGRRGSLFALFTFGGVACIGLAFVPACGDLVWLGITLAMLGKFGIASAFGMVYVYSAELFPTPLRSTGVGMCSLFARIGGILAPQLILMGTVWKPLPPIVFGVTSIFAGILILTLPETLGTKLPETLEEAEEFGKKQRHKVHLVSYDGYGEIRKINGNKEYDIASV
ncbi:organic cation transporter protein-like [Saccoglossus kowalevskii]